MVKAANGVVEVTKDWIERIFALYNAGYLVKLDSYADILSAEQSLASSGKASSSIVMPDESTNEDQPAGVLLKNYEQTSFYQVILQYCKHRTLAPSRVKVYKVLARQLRRFELFIQHTTSPLFSLNYDTMSMQDLENFRDYVRNEYKYKEKYPVIFRSIVIVSRITVLCSFIFCPIFAPEKKTSKSYGQIEITLLPTVSEGA